uniref:T-cell leukemia/lymphoma protein 1A n=1 Tax=Cricetulus griseus TaxID=10029 RepID=A0A8C2QG54_CRIGR
MAEQPVYRPETPQDPQRLWIWERHVYLDENKRSWLPIVLKTDEKFQVILRQQDVPLGLAMIPEQLEAYELPLMWQLYPGKKYRGSDSMLWQILYHIKATPVSLPTPGPQERCLKKSWPEVPPSHAPLPACSAVLVGPLLYSLPSPQQVAPEKLVAVPLSLSTD